MERRRARRWKKPPGPPGKWTRADLLAGYKHALAENKDLRGVVARRDRRIEKLEGDKKGLVKKAADLVDHAAGLEKELEEARRTSSALAAANLEMERRGRGRAKRDGPAAQKRRRQRGRAFTPLSNPRKGGPKPGEEGLPTVSEFLGDPDRPVDEEYEIDQKVCPVDGVTPLSEPVESFGQTVIDAEVRVSKIGTTKFRRWCSRCKKMHTPNSPIALPNSRFSLRMDVTMVALRVSGLPYGRARFLASSLLRIRIDEDDMVRAVHRVSKHLGPLYDEFKRQVRASDVVNVDETRWWINGAAAWLWDFVTKWTVLFVIGPGRGGEVPRAVLEGFEGTVCKDSYGATNGIGTAEQVCLQHFSREIDRTRDYKDPGPEFTRRMAPTLVRIIRDAKGAAKYKTEKKRLECKKRLEARVARMAQVEWTDPDCKRFAKRLKREGCKMFTFLEVDGVDWHNNDGERPFRPSASIRKVTGGNRSAEGAGDHAVLHSVERCCNARGWDFCGSVAKYLAGNAIVRRVRPPGGGGGGRGGRAKRAGARRLAWPVLDGPTVGDLAAPPPKRPRKPRQQAKPPPKRPRGPRKSGRAGRAKAAR